MKFAITALFLALSASAVRADFIFEFEDHTYKLVTTPTDWITARNAAAEQTLNGEPGYLAVIESAAENAAIYDAIIAELSVLDFDGTRAADGGDASFVWLGANDVVTEGVWVWDNTQEQFWAGDFNGAAVNGQYSNWGVEPDNAGNQDAGAIALEDWPVDFGDVGVASEWNDLAIDNSLYYLIEFDTPAATTRVALEEPARGQIYSGVGNLRGWAISSEGIEKIEVFIDQNPEPAFRAPYGGPRGDVASVFPDIEDAAESGFSLAFSYGSLGAGEHTIEVKATDTFGNAITQSATFTVVTFEKSFILPTDNVDFTNAVFATEGDTIRVQNASIAGVIYDLVMKWRPAEQGMEIIEITPLTTPPDTPE